MPHRMSPLSHSLAAPLLPSLYTSPPLPRPGAGRQGHQEGQVGGGQAQEGGGGGWVPACWATSRGAVTCCPRCPYPAGCASLDGRQLMPTLYYPPPPPPRRLQPPPRSSASRRRRRWVGGWAGRAGAGDPGCEAARGQASMSLPLPHACRRCRCAARSPACQRSLLPPPAPLRPRQDPNAPKRATSAFFYFSQDHRGVGGWVGTLGRRALSGTAVGRAAVARYRLAFPSAPWSLCLAAHPQGLTRLLLCGRRHICVAPELPLPPRIASVGA